MKIEPTAGTSSTDGKYEGLVNELMYETATISSAVASLAPSSSSEDEEELVTVQEMSPKETNALLNENMVTSGKLKRKHSQIEMANLQKTDEEPEVSADFLACVFKWHQLQIRRIF